MTKIMIVDDETDLREMVEILLKKEGFETETAEDGQEFLQKIDKFKPDLVTLDVIMPGISIDEIFKNLKNKSCKPKIILLTVVSISDEEKNKLSDFGVIEYIKKPFEFKDLIGAVRKWAITKNQ